jgi:hypothetical protein
MYGSLKAIANWNAPWKISNGVENFVLHALQFH